MGLNEKIVKKTQNVVLFGAGNEGKYLATRMSKFSDPINILGFADSFRGGSYFGYQIFNVDQLKELETDIIITVKNNVFMKEIFESLEGFRNGKIYWQHHNKNQRSVTTYNSFLKKECIELKDRVREKGILPHVEMHVADHCNLNCAGCTHFSPIFTNKFPNRKQRIKDVKTLSKKIGVILQFFIMGGEPFLNPEIDQYIEEIREILPDTELWVVTNGLLIPTIKEEVLECLYKNNVGVSVSEYEPTHCMIDKIIDRLETAELSYNIRSFDIKQKFIKPLSLKENSQYKNSCISDGCVNIYDGKIARCPTLMYINKFNETFGTSFPNEGIYDLDSCSTGNDLVSLMQKKVPLCKHCVENEIKWSRCGSTVLLSDFAVDK